METFAIRVKTRRETLGLTQGEVADRAGLKQPDISKIERGLILQTTELLGLARALQCSPYWLESGEGEINGGQNESVQSMDLAQAILAIGAALNRADDIAKDQSRPIFEALIKNPGRAAELGKRLQETLTQRHSPEAGSKRAAS